MNKFFQFLILFILAQTVVAGTDIQNGGSGIQVNGQVATFYRSQFKVDPVESGEAMDSLLETVRDLPISTRAKMELFNIITPAFDRKYYAADKNSIDIKTLQTIKEDYQKVTGMTLDNLTIFAVTDSEKQITLLLPDFFRLDLFGQMSMLLHESLWISGRVENYARMLSIDNDFQAYLDYPKNCKAQYNLIKNLETLFEKKSWAINLALGCDLHIYYARTQEDAAMSDFMNAESLDIFARIYLATIFEKEDDINNLNSEFLKSLLASPPGLFPATKLAMISEMQAGRMFKRIDKHPYLMAQLSWDEPFSEQNKTIVKNYLNKTSPLPTESDPDTFRLILTPLGSLFLE